MKKKIVNTKPPKIWKSKGNLHFCVKCFMCWRQNGLSFMSMADMISAIVQVRLMWTDSKSSSCPSAYGFHFCYRFVQGMPESNIKPRTTQSLSDLPKLVT